MHTRIWCALCSILKQGIHWSDLYW